MRVLVAHNFYQQPGGEDQVFHSELALLEKLYADERAAFAKDPGAARKLLATGEAPRNGVLPVAEVAAASVVASTVMNMDDAVTKR